MIKKITVIILITLNIFVFASCKKGNDDNVLPEDQTENDENRTENDQNAQDGQNNESENQENTDIDNNSNSEYDNNESNNGHDNQDEQANNDNNGQNEEENNQENSREYVVKQGDTLWSISQEFYGSGNKWTLIYDANNMESFDEVKAGIKIFIPYHEESKPVLNVLDEEVLNELPNDVIPWSYIRNGQNTPDANNHYKKLLNEYDGYYTNENTEKKVCLTFDEGYENGYTPLILDTLKKHNVKAVFFITGSYLSMHEDLVKRMIDEGHVVGNHTMTHPDLTTVTLSELEYETLAVDEMLMERFGIKTRYLRPPTGNFSERVLCALEQMGYTTVFWSFAYDDWYTDKIRGPQYTIDLVMKNLHDDGVYLLHAVSKDNAQALDELIVKIREEGYTIGLPDF